MWESYRISITNPLDEKEEYFYHAGSGELIGIQEYAYSWYVSPGDYVSYVNGLVNNLRSAPKTLYFLTTLYHNGNNGEIKRITYPEGGYIEYMNYDSSTGKPRTINEFHGSGVIHSSYYTYNTNGRITSFTDAKGNIFTFNYYPDDIDIETIKLDLISIPGDDDITLKTFTYNDSTHDLASVTDRPGNIIEFFYNTYGQLNSIIHARGTAIEMTTELVYDSATHELTEIRRGGNTVASFTYDSIGRVKDITDAADFTLTYLEYNNLDQPTKITFPDTVFNSDTPLSKFISINYSSCCPRMIDNITNRAGLTTNYIYDALKQLTEVQNPEGTIKYEYDANGNSSKLIDADSKATLFEYDLDNRMIKKIYADGKFIEYEYDPAGLLTKITTSRNITKDYTYDETHNLLTINYSDGTPDFTFTYDEYDRLITTSNGLYTYQYGYDNIDRLTSINGPWDDDTATFEYNDLGHLKNLSQQGGQTITYYYDYDPENLDYIGLGRLKDIQAGAYTYTYNYTGVNPLIQSLERPNGSITNYIYNDPLKRPTDIINRDSSDQVINSHAFTYNNLDIIDTETLDTGTPMSSFTEGLKTYNYDNVNQLLNSTSPPETFAYDNDGNMTQGYTPDGYVFTASYDAENRLTSIEYTDSESVVHRTEHFYSGNGLLAEVKEYEDASLINTIRIIRAGFLPIQERDENNNVTGQYTWGLNMDGGIGGLLNLNQGGNDYSYLYDGKGNVMALIDSNQNVVASYRYDAFGVLRAETGIFDQPFQFSTKRYNESTGLSYYGFRFYNPAIGRWMTRDPLGEAGGINLYGFVGNSPGNWVDPWGLWGKDVHYDLTYKLALEAGFSTGAARLIASANQGLDEGFFTRPYNPLGGTQLHFMSPEDARTAVDQATQKCDLNYFGQTLHMLQDTYSHYTQGYRWFTGGHVWDTIFNKPRTNPDISYTNKNTEDMSDETLKYLKKFKRKYYQAF
jgi:RHS repeat-associated protein